MQVCLPVFYIQYLKSVRKLPGYGEISFPHCKCDARKDGFVIVSVGIKNLKLHACDMHGVLEVFAVSKFFMSYEGNRISQLLVKSVSFPDSLIYPVLNSMVEILAQI